MPEPLGKEVVICCFVYADHAGEKLTRFSRSGFIIFLQMAPITISIVRIRLRPPLLAQSLWLRILRVNICVAFDINLG